MMISFDLFKREWNEPISEGEGYLLLDVEHPLSFSIGINLKGKKSLLISDVVVRSNISSTYAVGVNSHLSKQGNPCLEFELLQEEYFEEFLSLCWDLIESTSHSKEPVHDLVSKYRSWQKLLQNKSKEEMSFEKQKGLLGELLYFDLLLENLPSNKVIDAWVGPDGADQDFVFDNFWTEVKSVALSAKSVHISSLQQLEQEISGNLLLQFLEKTVDCKNSINLPKEIELIRKKLKDVFLIDAFNIKLVKYGYKEEDVEKYKNNNFRFVRSTFYRVDPDFPRLTRNNISKCIVDCQYEISLSGIEQYEEE